MLSRRSLLAGAGAAVTIRPAFAQGWSPSRPIRFIVPFVAGGSTDIAARIIADRMGETLGQPVVVENRGGSGGNIGGEMVARAAPDGHTILMGVTGLLTTNPHIYKSMPFDPAKDLAPVSMAYTSDMVIVVPNSLPVRTLQEFVAYAKARPGQLSFGSSGHGASTHTAAELFRLAAGIDIVHVPYRGSAPAVQDLAGGRVQMLIDGYSLMRAVVEGGKARVLAVAAAERQEILPQVPTTAEAGLPGFVAGSWHALVAPAGTPPVVLRRLEEAVAWALRETDLPHAFAGQGVAARFRNAAETRAFITAERERWGRVVREAGITLD